MGDADRAHERDAAREEFAAFVDEYVAPHAEAWDREEAVPREAIDRLGEAGLLGATVPAEFGGRAMDEVTFGCLCEEVGRGSFSLLSLLTVHGMVTRSLATWGTDEQRARWLPRLATGECLGAFALTEPDVGSDARSVATRLDPAEGGFLLTGAKRWISFGQVANLFLVVGNAGDQSAAVLVERETEGLRVEPIGEMLGLRAARLAEIRFEGCRVPEANLLAGVGFGFSHVVNHALDFGRYTIGWGCVGLLRLCLESSVAYAGARTQFGTPLRNHQLVQEMIADMATDLAAARLLCIEAGKGREAMDPDAIMGATTAKYFASRAAVRAALAAVQIHGANGCSSDYPVQRALRDAKVCEIIEGSNQMQQIIIAKSAMMRKRKRKRGRRA